MKIDEAIKTLQVMYDVSNHPMSEISTDEAEAIKIAISAMQELQEYRKLGTLEEVRDAVEKQEEERPIAVLGTFGGEEYECKNCGSPVDHMDDYCKWCGQKQDWSEVEE